MSDKRKYRLALLEDRTLREVFHIRMSALGAFSFLTFVFIALLVMLSVLIVYTPVRNILPGYSESIRQQLIDESARVDSLQTDIRLQRQYLDVIKQLTAGDIQSDSVQSLDSLQRVERARIAEQRNEATDEFIAQYEQKERDRIMLFDTQTSGSTQTLFRPVRGTIVQRPDFGRHEYALTLHVAKNENVSSVLRGTIVYVERDLDNTATVVIQHYQYVSTYRHVAKVSKSVGTRVEAGESIGLMDGEHDLMFELWKSGQPVQPEEVIVW